MIFIDTIARLGIALVGCWLVYFTVATTIRVFVLPRGENAWLARQIFTVTYQLFLFFAYKKETFEDRDAVLALFAPVVLMIQPLIYLALIVIGFMPIYWVLSPEPLSAFRANRVIGAASMRLRFGFQSGVALLINYCSDWPLF